MLNAPKRVRKQQRAGEINPYAATTRTSAPVPATRSICVFRSEALRLKDGKAMLEREALDGLWTRGANRGRPPDPAGSGRAQCRDRRAGEPLRLAPRIQGYRRKRGAGRRDQADLRSCFAMRARMRCCLSCERCSTNTLPFR